MRLDVGDAGAVADALDGVDAVLMCADRRNTALARACLERGIAYADEVIAPRPFLEVLAGHGFTAALSYDER
ncbi:hypothetical protein [Actinomadura flavalba]|uniref:hypothetical protein n=1 Tax=Actinomadura flavalba TaxID=1120938 RepID=UPI000380C921|nr:hypothetical protein [Actinomadura flavalba]